MVPKSSSIRCWSDRLRSRDAEKNNRKLQKNNNKLHASAVLFCFFHAWWISCAMQTWIVRLKSKTILRRSVKRFANKLESVKMGQILKKSFYSHVFRRQFPEIIQIREKIKKTLGWGVQNLAFRKIRFFFGKILYNFPTKLSQRLTSSNVIKFVPNFGNLEIYADLQIFYLFANHFKCIPIKCIDISLLGKTEVFPAIHSYRTNNQKRAPHLLHIRENTIPLQNSRRKSGKWKDYHGGESTWVTWPVGQSLNRSGSGTNLVRTRVWPGANPSGLLVQVLNRSKAVLDSWRAKEEGAHVDSLPWNSYENYDGNWPKNNKKGTSLLDAQIWI